MNDVGPTDRAGAPPADRPARRPAAVAPMVTTAITVVGATMAIVLIAHARSSAWAEGRDLVMR